MKYLIFLGLYLNAFCTLAQEASPAFDGHKWVAPYHLDIPTNWTIERFLLPISFAPQIRYMGVEDIRFTPGWANVKSEEYWSYAFLWYLDGAVETTEEIIAANLKAYYTGLFKVNTGNTALTPEQLRPVTTSFEKVPTGIGDRATFTGTIEMMDYMQLKPVTLHCRVHARSCTENNKTVIFYELSPQPPNHDIWNRLHQLWATFTCKKK